MSFEALGLGPEVLQAVTDAGYSEPTPIQAQAIPLVLMGRDVLGCAQTGTGKTASFTLPMIDILAAGRAKARMPRSLVLAPTRELAAQVAKSFETYGKYHKLSMALLIGGESFGPQEAKLDRGVDVLIATPGRLIDHFERGKILLNDVKILVIDEADRMLDMGFIPDVERIVSFLPKIRQTLFFSATFPPEVRRLADAFLINPKQVTVAPPATTASTVEAFQVRCASDDYLKREALRAVIKSETVTNALIFSNRKVDVDILVKSLKRHGFSVAGMHGDMAQSARTETLAAFKNGDIQLLVATDVAGRGIDVVGLSHVFNYDVPIHAEDYVHRIGRTGRAGRSGRAFMLVTPDDTKFLDAIVKMTGGKEIAVHKVPEYEGISDEEFAELAAEAATSRGRRGRGGAKGGRGSDRSGKGNDRGRGRDRNRRSERPQEEREPAPQAAAPVAAETVVETVAEMPQPDETALREAAAQQHDAPRPETGREERRERRPRRDNRQDHRQDHRQNQRGSDRNQDRSQDRAAAERPQQDRQDRNQERRERRPRNEPPEPQVISFGDNIPAFLMRPVRKVTEQTE
ncbi:MAG TPA: DEAD/DEAH box helicase [Alphaproteobacteria bacterium]|nr:DEAD/DEAH box helicase [Alphaproteobacteria bacterium]